MKKIILISIIFSLFFTINSYSQHKEYEGNGDDIITLDKPDDGLPALLVVNGNRSESHFSITGYDGNRNRTSLLVNTTDHYSGIVAVDLPPRTDTKLLEISASGPWIVHVYSIGAAPKISVGEEFEDKGDNVLWVEGDASIASVSGNSSQRHFSITSYDGSGNRSGLLVNTTDRYSGRVMVPNNTLLLEVNATGDWSIKLE